MRNRFQSGDIVYSKKAPKVKLMIRRYIDERYYCKVLNSPYSPELSFYERDLIASSNPADKGSN
ncbi:MAG: hypothetical protein ACFHWX_12870 [Bacteroidota bacterium]